MTVPPKRKPKSSHATTGVNMRAAAAGEPPWSGRTGRPSKYKPEYDDMAKKLCLLGYTNQQLADFFKVQVQTINEWDIHIESFSKALQEGRDVADARVAISLYQRAVGYSHPAEQIVTLTEGRGGASYVERVPIVKQYPPDTAAAYIWLKNRRRDMWYDAGQGGGTPADDAARIAREAIRAALAEEDGPAALPPPEPEEDDDAV